LREQNLVTHSKTANLKSQLRIPVIAAPLFIISNPQLVIAQCTSGIVGSFPALNARQPSQVDEWLHEITEGIAAWNVKNPQNLAAPFAVNQIVHKSNTRLEHDVATCVKWKVPLIITSLGARPELNDAIHSYGGITFHDVININHSHKALEKGADGLIAVAAGAGGHAGTVSPFALVQEIRQFFDGPLALAGAITTGRAVRAAEVMGADFGYIGSLFIATSEANAIQSYKQALLDSTADDIIYSNYFTGVHGNYLRESIVKAGLDPNNLPNRDPSKMDFSSSANNDVKAWKDIWGCGQGIGLVNKIEPSAIVIDRLIKEYEIAKFK
jgi:nitronate monooxygenase